MARSESLREFREPDAQEIARWSGSPDEVRRWAGSDPGWPVDVAVFGRWHADPDVRPYILCDGEETIGYGEVWVDEPEQEVELARIIVSPDRRGRGVGRRLVRQLLERAALAGLPDAFVRVVPENAAAIGCYRGAGFSPVSEPERGEFNRGQPVDYVWMHYPWVEAAGVTLDHGARSNPRGDALRDAENVALSGLYVYPIKSCAGISLTSAELTATGLRHDRRWMLVDGVGEFMSQRAHPRMALISTHLSDEHLTVSAPGMPDLPIPLQQQNGDLIDVEVWGDVNKGALVGEEADRWFSEFLRFPCRLVRKPDHDPRPVDSIYAQSGDQTSFADGFAFLLISEASLDDLNSRLEDPLPMNRFRPNFVVRGCDAYAEDEWDRLHIRGIPFRVAEACPRCAITTTDQETTERGKEPLRTLATYRKFDGEVYFGRNLIHDALGTVRVGDAVETTPRL